MRYVIVDPEGSSRAYFSWLRDVREWARALKARDPEMLDELLLVTYDASGAQIANQLLSDFVPEVAPTVLVAAQREMRVRDLGLAETTAGLLADWSGTATSTAPEFRHQRTPASGRRSRERAETAVG